MVISDEKYVSLCECPECKGNLINIKNEREIVCCQCGLILSEQNFDISHSEKRAFNTEQKNRRERTGLPISPLIPDIALCTQISKNNIYNQNLKRAIKIDSQLSWRTKNILIAVTELKRLSHILNVPGYARKAALKLYKEVCDSNILKGRSIIGMIAVCLFYTCKIKQIPITFQDILNETPVNEKKIKRFYGFLVRTLNLKIPINNPIALIPLYITMLNLNFIVEKITINILDAYLKTNSLDGKNPNGICAGAIYLASKFKNKKVSQKRIADIVGITDITLRRRYKEIINKIDLRILNK